MARRAAWTSASSISPGALGQGSGAELALEGRSAEDEGVRAGGGGPDIAYCYDVELLNEEGENGRL